MLHRILPALVAVAATMALVAPAPALAQTGMVKGKVVDAEGKPVPDAAVTVEFVGGTSRKLSTKSDRRGEFVQLGLQSGGYRVSATDPKLGTGFADIQVRVGNTSEVTIRLSTVPPGTDPKVAKLKGAFDEGVAASRAQNHDWRSPSSRRHWPSSPPAPSATSTSATPTCRRRTRSRRRRTGRRRSSRKPTMPTR